MEKTLSNKLSNEEYEALIAKTFEGKIVKEKTIVTGKKVFTYIIGKEDGEKISFNYYRSIS